MNRDEIRKLIGGYATGTLTPEEQALLFEAALDDQSLFDELAREQSLKELLDDPAVRAELLDAVTEAPRSAALPWWRRPWVMTLAGATALASLTIGVMIQLDRSAKPAATQVANVALKDKPPASSAAPESKPVSTAPAPSQNRPAEAGKLEPATQAASTADDKAGRPDAGTKAPLGTAAEPAPAPQPSLAKPSAKDNPPQAAQESVEVSAAAPALALAPQKETDEKLAKKEKSAESVARAEPQRPATPVVPSDASQDELRRQAPAQYSLPRKTARDVDARKADQPAGPGGAAGGAATGFAMKQRASTPPIRYRLLKQNGSTFDELAGNAEVKPDDSLVLELRPTVAGLLTVNRGSEPAPVVSMVVEAGGSYRVPLRLPSAGPTADYQIVLAPQGALASNSLVRSESATVPSVHVRFRIRR